MTVDGEPGAQEPQRRATATSSRSRSPPLRAHDLTAEEIPLDVRFEDEHLIVLSKAAGMVVHPAHGHWTGTLVHALLGYSDELGALQGDERPGHRAPARQGHLGADARREGRRHAARAPGADPAAARGPALRVARARRASSPDTGLIDAPIGRAPQDRHAAWRSRRGRARGRRSRASACWSASRRAAADDGYTLVECKLQTGRTHQIRVHMEYIHHPVVGDPLYGRKRKGADLGLTRQFLHSYRLRFEHPVTDAEIDLFDWLPRDLGAALASIADRSEGRTAGGRRGATRLRGDPPLA